MNRSRAELAVIVSAATVGIIAASSAVVAAIADAAARVQTMLQSLALLSIVVLVAGTAALQLTRDRRRVSSISTGAPSDRDHVQTPPRAPIEEVLEAAPRRTSKKAAPLSDAARRTLLGRPGIAAAPPPGTDPPHRLDPFDVAEEFWRERNGVSPSFRYKLYESKRRQRELQLVGRRQRIWRHNSKLAGYALADSLGVEVPRRYHASVSADAIDHLELPDRFVLKPHNGAANRGIFLLVRQADGFLDLMDMQEKTISDVAAACRQLVDAGVISPRFAVEELLEPPTPLGAHVHVPDDLKVYCFYDRPVLVMQRRMYDRRRAREQRTPVPASWMFKFWSAAWEDLGKVKFADRCWETLEKPPGGDAVLAAAGLVASTLAVPFVRLDLYDTDRGPVFGEVTPHPGPPEVWTDEMDELLGRHWELAETRLQAEGVDLTEPLEND